jgi:hypothetical protein
MMVRGCFIFTSASDGEVMADQKMVSIDVDSLKSEVKKAAVCGQDIEGKHVDKQGGQRTRAPSSFFRTT